MNRQPLVEIKGIKKFFHVDRGILSHRKKGVVKAVDDVSFTIYKGETLGLIGESGCGKSTLARVLLGLTESSGGEIRYAGQTLDKKSLESLRWKMQMVFQDPYSSLDPRMNIRRIVEEPLRIHERMSRKRRYDIVLPLMKQLGFDEDSLKKYPHEFSGGQRQRIGIARAFVLEPEFIICDEPVSALDVSIQAQILNLFKKMQRERSVTYLFISHDMSVVKHVSDRIAVMYLGQLMELAGKQALFSNTLHPYSIALMSAIPVPNPSYQRKRILLEGDLPSPLNPPAGCPFQTRCPNTMDICRKARPALTEPEPGHFVACHLFTAQ